MRIVNYDYIESNGLLLLITGGLSVSDLQGLKGLLTPFWLFSTMPALITITNINSIVLGE